MEEGGSEGVEEWGSEGVEESLVASRLRLDDVAGSRLARRGGPRTAAHGGAQAKGTAAAREANIAKTADAVRDGRGKTRAWQGAKAHSEAEPPMRRSQATRIADDRRGSGGRMSGRERRAPPPRLSRCRRFHARLRFGPQRDGGLSDEPSCAGLHPEPNLEIGERVQGRASRPYQSMSTVARTEAARERERGKDYGIGGVGEWRSEGVREWRSGGVASR